MKLVLYSGGSEDENHFLNQRALALTEVKSPKVTLIPSSSYDAEVDFKFFVQEFSELGVQRFMQFCVDIPYTKTLLQEMLKSDLIFLGGGNTFYFLKHLKKAGMFEHFNKFLIVLTPHVHTASFPHFDRDENPFDMKNLSAMRLVNFEFFPHYKNSKRYDAELLHHSKKSKLPLYACADGGGIIVEDDQIAFSGKCSQFYQGKKLVLSQYKQIQ